MYVHPSPLTPIHRSHPLLPPLTLIVLVSVLSRPKRNLCKSRDIFCRMADKSDIQCHAEPYWELPLYLSQKCCFALNIAQNEYDTKMCALIFSRRNPVKSNDVSYRNLWPETKTRMFSYQCSTLGSIRITWYAQRGFVVCILAILTWSENDFPAHLGRWVQVSLDDDSRAQEDLFLSKWNGCMGVILLHRGFFDASAGPTLIVRSYPLWTCSLCSSSVRAMEWDRGGGVYKFHFTSKATFPESDEQYELWIQTVS